MMFLRKRSTNSTLSAFSLLSLLLVSTLGPRLVQGGDVLTTDGFSKCLESEDLVIDKMHITYDKAVGKVAFDVGGTSKKEQNVKAELVVTAYGREVYRKKFNPCVDGIELLCPGSSRLFSPTCSSVLIDLYSAKGQVRGQRHLTDTCRVPGNDSRNCVSNT